MKKSILLTTMSLFCLLATAQVKVTYSSQKTNITFKRCVATGTSGYIDFLISNLSNTEIQYTIYNGDTRVRLYDDEGNCYTTYKYIAPVVFGGTTQKCCSVPAGTSVKCRISFSGLDEYATQLTNVTIEIYEQPYREMCKAETLVITDIPITRRD